MTLPLSRAIAPDLELVPEIGSTNAELAARASRGAQPNFAVLVTTDQTAGRGRLGRQWVAPRDTTLAVSVLLHRDAGDLGWIPLLAGVAMRRAVSGLVSAPVTLKWPNDVQVSGLKVSGLLAELVPGGVVVGAGLNLTMTAEQLPTPTATSLTLQGADADGLLDRALAAYLGELRRLFAMLDRDAPALRTAVAEACDTIGRSVRVELPGGGELLGVARRLDEQGRLVVAADGIEHAIAAGDITHLRYPDSGVR